MAHSVPSSLLDNLHEQLGPAGFMTDPADIAPYLTDVRSLYAGSSPAVLRPSSTAEVSAIVTACHAAGVAVVPQGGNTGYMGGAVPGLNEPALLMSMGRMKAVRHIDPVDYSMVAEAGCVLADLQRTAADVDRLFPLSLAAQGTCTIGGNLSTNAGGVQVLRFGNARDLVLGLEVVLPDGQVWNGLRLLRKDNTGYDLKQLFLGAEGTLGIITAAALKLYPAAKETVTGLIAIDNPAAATSLLGSLRAASGDAVTSFEYFHRTCLDMVIEYIPQCVDPMADRHEHYALIELASGQADGSLMALCERALSDAVEDGWVLDAVIAASSDQASRLWRLRESIPEAQRVGGPSIKHDVSVQVSRVPEFLNRGRQLLESMIPGVRVVAFGHMGDGNVHFNLSPPPGGDEAEFLAHTDAVTTAVHDLIAEMEGSFSAEHGIGRLKRKDMDRYRDPLELRLMRKVKDALDPSGIMNPGVIV
ncbi:MAG: FAD-binding oxidoreductase [Chromatiales bacterium]|jgi:FAD/FMN-containing dehydrogenase|nr:FAD-binding oxidoreductase [Chromatiales bacterium]